MNLKVILLFLVVVYPVENANILFYVPLPTKSHQVIFQTVWRELSLRGHNLTVITPIPLNDKSLVNVTEVDINFVHEEFLKSVDPKEFKHFLEKPGVLQLFTNRISTSELLLFMNKRILRVPEVQTILQGNQKFDLVITEWILSTGGLFAWKFNCPLVGITSYGAPTVYLDSIGNPNHPVYTPDQNLPFKRELSFKERLISVLYSVFVRIHHYWIHLPREDAFLRKNYAADMPYLGDIERNISLLLLNRNPVFHKIMPTVPLVVELGGVRSLKTSTQVLNTELKNVLDNSKNGVIYFSLGSSYVSSFLSKEVIDVFVKVFSGLPYDVVWKWESPEFPNKPKNVFIQRWLPQSAVLAHSKVKLFITQGGLQSMEETINMHVPIIGMPTHGDQFINMDTAVKYGYGLLLNIEDLTVQKLKEAIMKVINNPRYKENIIKMDELMRDFPEKGLDKAIWWIEYVLRHGGTKHLRSPILDIPWYQYLLLDVILLLLVLVFFVVYIYYKIMMILYKIFRNRNKIKKQ